MGPRSRTTTDEEFVKAWQSTPTARAAADVLGCSLTSAKVRASRLRGMGVPLKKHWVGRPRKVMDVEGLKRLAAESLPPAMDP